MGVAVHRSTIHARGRQHPAVDPRAKAAIFRPDERFPAEIAPGANPS